MNNKNFKTLEILVEARKGQKRKYDKESYEEPEDEFASNDRDMRLGKMKTPENVPQYKISMDSPAFTIDALPRDFAKAKNQDLNFCRKLLLKKKVFLLKKFYNLKQEVIIDCFLEDSESSIEDVLSFVLKILEGIAVKDIKNILCIKCNLHDSGSDPFNHNQNYIGIVIKEFKKKEYPGKIIIGGKNEHKKFLEYRKLFFLKYVQ